MKALTTVLLLACLACGGRTLEEPVDVPRATQAVMVFVDNISWDMVTVFVMVSPAAAEQIGQCRSQEKCTYALNPQLSGFVRTAGWVWLTYRPQAERRRNVYYDLGRVPTPRPGEIIVALIKNQASGSTLRVGR